MRPPPEEAPMLDQVFAAIAGRRETLLERGKELQALDLNDPRNHERMNRLAVRLGDLRDLRERIEDLGAGATRERVLEMIAADEQRMLAEGKVLQAQDLNDEVLHARINLLGLRLSQLQLLKRQIERLAT